MLCSRKDPAAEFEIIEGKQGEKSAKDALSFVQMKPAKAWSMMSLPKKSTV